MDSNKKPPDEGGTFTIRNAAGESTGPIPFDTPLTSEHLRIYMGRGALDEERQTTTCPDCGQIVHADSAVAPLCYMDALWRQDQAELREDER